MMKKSTVLLFTMVIVLALNGVSRAQSVGTVFTYQGKLMDGGSAANGFYDFMFELHDDASADSQVGGTVVKDEVGVYGGYFTVGLDFGGVFDGDKR